MDKEYWDRRKVKPNLKGKLRVVKSRKYPTPLHKRLAKIELAYDAEEDRYNKAFAEWFSAEGVKGPKPMKRAVYMARLLKTAASLMKKIDRLLKARGIVMPQAPPPTKPVNDPGNVLVSDAPMIERVEDTGLIKDIKEGRRRQW